MAPTRIDSPERVVTAIHDALRRNMSRDERIVLIGEDIEGPYGGAFKVTKDLSREFPGRVRNTPISEAAIVGLGNGLALGGLVPVCEIMFGDFLTLAADQIINHASKFRYMYNDQVDLRLVVRTPMGGKRGYGPTHSQSLEKHFLGLPGTRMLALHHRYDPGPVYDALFATIDRPTIVIENKLLYGLRIGDSAPEGYVLEHTDEPFPTTRLRPEGEPDATILCYGGMLADVEKALDPLFDEHEIACEVICPTQLYPLDLRPIVESVRPDGPAAGRRGGDRLRRLRGRGRGPARRARPRGAATAPPPGLAGAPDPLVRAAGEGAPARPGPRRGGCPGALRVMSEPTPIVVPRENVNDESATLVAWSVAGRGRVEAGQVVAQVETSKAVVDLPAPVGGILRTRPAGRGRSHRRRDRLDRRRGGRVAPDPPPRPRRRRPLARTPIAIAPVPPTAGSFPARAVRAPDRRRGEDRPAQVRGTGRGGRLTKADVMAHLAPASTVGHPGPRATRFSQEARELVRQLGLDEHAFEGRGLVRSRDVLPASPAVQAAADRLAGAPGPSQAGRGGGGGDAVGAAAPGEADRGEVPPLGPRDDPGQRGDRHLPDPGVPRGGGAASRSRATRRPSSSSRPPGCSGSTPPSTPSTTTARSAITRRSTSASPSTPGAA